MTAEARHPVNPKRETLDEQIQSLRELIDALERRVPHIERAGEAQIARDADSLRRKAVARLAELERDRKSTAAGSRTPRPA